VLWDICPRLLSQPSIPRPPCQIIRIGLESNSRWYINWVAGQHQSHIFHTIQAVCSRSFRNKSFPFFDLITASHPKD
jgi:hypothetical protein